ncbi:hypothetical protein [Castellaniella defragrans]|uniref:DUF4399 domain-containing protein n=1 Tax=Castellaniella defragrans TaxID=75697 RepID=A0A7W9WNJ9_CASDE|nr:hypothetical protein [Castellaniella defragrans]MBB6085492.1 hypothetical protein [Castellaniella defragrans]
MTGRITQFIATGSMALLLFSGKALSVTLPSFVIQSPAQGAVVNSPVILQIDVQGATIGQPIEGLDHLHLSVDGGSEVAIYRNGLLRLPLAPGKHTIFVELAGPTHEGLLPPKSVAFTVR